MSPESLTPAVPTMPELPAQPSPEKPGYETSEFWITLVSTIVPNLVTVLAIFKLVPNEVASTLSAALVAVIGGIITLVVAIRYIKSRTDVKVRAMELNDVAKSRRFDVQTTRLQLFMQLVDRGVIEKDVLKKEFSLG